MQKLIFFIFLFSFYLISGAFAQQIVSEFKIDSTLQVEAGFDDKGVQPLFSKGGIYSRWGARAFEAQDLPGQGFVIRNGSSFHAFADDGSPLWSKNLRPTYAAKDEPDFKTVTDSSGIWLLEIKNKPRLFSELTLTHLDAKGNPRVKVIPTGEYGGLTTAFTTSGHLHLIFIKVPGMQQLSTYSQVSLAKKDLSLVQVELEMPRSEAEKTSPFTGGPMDSWREIATVQGSVILSKFFVKEGQLTLFIREVDHGGKVGKPILMNLDEVVGSADVMNIPTLYFDPRREEIHVFGTTYAMGERRKTNGLYWCRFPRGSSEPSMTNHWLFSSISRQMPNGMGDAEIFERFLSQIITLPQISPGLWNFEMETGALHIFLLKNAMVRELGPTEAYELRINKEGNLTGAFDVEFSRWPHLFEGYWVQTLSETSMWTASKGRLSADGADPLTWLRFRKAGKKAILWRIIEREKDAILLSFNAETGIVKGIHLKK